MKRAAPARSSACNFRCSDPVNFYPKLDSLAASMIYIMLIMPRKVGKPTKYTPALGANLVKLMLAGNYVSTACAACGIDDSTYYRWMALAESGGPGAKVYIELRTALKEAEAAAEAAAVAGVLRAGRKPQNWPALMTFLQRRHPSRWAERQELAEAMKQGISFLEEIAAAYKAPPGAAGLSGPGPVALPAGPGNNMSDVFEGMPADGPGCPDDSRGSDAPPALEAAPQPEAPIV